MICDTKYLLNIVLLTVGLGACNEGIEIPVPENRQAVYQITSAGQTIEYAGIRLEVPDGAVTDSQEITFLTQDICDTSYGNIYFFLCEAVNLSPSSLELAKPARLSISQDLHWINVVDQDRYRINMNEEKIAIYKLDAEKHTSVELDNCELSYDKDNLTVSSEITEFGVYQIGLDETYINFRKGFMKVRYENFAGTDSFQFNTDFIGLGSASYIPAYLMQAFTLEILVGDKDEQGIGYIESRISGVGRYEKIITEAQQEYFFAFYMPYEDYGYTIWSIDGDTAIINITRFDEGASSGKVNARVEGTWEGSAYKIPNDPELPTYISKVTVHFSVPKY